MSDPLAIRKRVDVSASVRQVWNAWTTVPGIQTFFAPDARVALREGGPYEILFMPNAPDGGQGSEGCQVLDFVEPDLLVFDWSFPPTLPSIRAERTTVELRFELIDESASRVWLTQSGWQRGGEWEEGRAYFVGAWDLVLGRLRHSFETGPISWSAPFDPIANGECYDVD